MRGGILLLGLVVATALGVAASAQNAAAQNAPEREAALRERVTRYWQARNDFNLVAAYPYYEPEFRTAYPLEQFLSNFQRLLRFRPQFLGIDRVVIDAEGRSARVGVRLRFKPADLNGEALDSVTEDAWLLIGDVWYHAREPMLPAI